MVLSGIVSEFYKVEQIQKPMENYKDIDSFKIRVSDLGLLCAKKQFVAKDVFYIVEELNDFKGDMVENYEFLQIHKSQYKRNIFLALKRITLRGQTLCI